MSDTLESGRPTPLPDQAKKRILEVDITQLSGFKDLGLIRTIGATDTQQLIKYLISNEILSPEHLKQVADFGSGLGGPIFALAALAKETDGIVYAIEKRESFANATASLNVIPSENVIGGKDGIEYLRSSPNKHGLITAMNFGPDYSGDLFRRLINASSLALRPDGVLVVTTGGSTLSAVKKVLEASGNSVTFIDPDTIGITYETIVIPKETCAALSRASPTS